MVYFFNSNVVDRPVQLFMGVDKYENEHLIKWGWPEDVWFHVDNFSSAHVYLRLEKGEDLSNVAESVIIDAAQLVKENSIQGCRMNDVDVVYTMWENLNKTESMDVGQVGFKNRKKVYKIRIEKKDNLIINRLNKTKRSLVKSEADFREEREQRDKQEREERKEMLRQQQKKDKKEEIKRKEEAEERSYARLMIADKMKSNRRNPANCDSDDSDDFM